jgi:hypothetical protein
MSHKKPVPPLAQGAVPRPRCPVCGMATYSRSGTHPQCMQASHDRLLRNANKPPVVPPAAGA